MKRLLAIVFSLAAIGSPAYAHQPVMDMAPRWSGGYGFQLRYQEFGSDQLLDGSTEIPNPLGLERNVSVTWLEGVYTFKPSIRATFKLPYVDQQRVKAVNGVGVHQSTSGLGVLVLGLPLKRYKNHGRVTQNWGLTPSIRIPTGESSGDFPIDDGSWDFGLSASYAWENPKVYQLYELFYWKQGQGRNGVRSGDTVGLDLNAGIHPLHSNETNTGMFLLWDVSAWHSDSPSGNNLTIASGGTRVLTGPVVVFYRENFMARVEFKIPAYERVDGVGLSVGNTLWVAFGAAF